MKKIERCERGWRTIRAIRRMLLAATLFMLIPSMALGALTEEAFEQWYEQWNTKLEAAAYQNK